MKVSAREAVSCTSCPGDTETPETEATLPGALLLPPSPVLLSHVFLQAVLQHSKVNLFPGAVCSILCLYIWSVPISSHTVNFCTLCFHAATSFSAQIHSHGGLWVHQTPHDFSKHSDINNLNRFQPHPRGASTGLYSQKCRHSPDLWPQHSLEKKTKFCHPPN